LPELSPIANAINILEIAAIIHQTEYHAGLDAITETKKELKTSQPNTFIAIFFDRIDGKLVMATYAAITTAGGSSNKGLYASECL
jgi:hypothetical protein